MSTTRPRCEAKVKSGARCAGEAKAGLRVCHIHDPANAESLAVGRSEGGKARWAKKPATSTLDPANPPEWWALACSRDVAGLLAHVCRESLMGSTEPRQLNAATLAAQALAKALEATDLQRRIEQLEQASKEGRDQ
jgi:uncharacterized protein YfaT (DUF1175 family)